MGFLNIHNHCDYQLIAAGILGNMQGKLGIAAWRWFAILFAAFPVLTPIIQALLHRRRNYNIHWVPSHVCELTVTIPKCTYLFPGTGGCSPIMYVSDRRIVNPR